MLWHAPRTANPSFPRHFQRTLTQADAPVLLHLLLHGTLVLVEVERLPRQTRIAKRLWLWWRGPWCPGPVPALAGLYPEVRPGAHLQILQADAELDHAAGAPSRAGRSVDLASAAGLHRTAPGTLHRGRPATALGASPAAEPSGAHPRARPPGISCAPGLAGYTDHCAKNPVAARQDGHRERVRGRHHATRLSTKAPQTTTSPPPITNRPIPTWSDGPPCLKGKLERGRTGARRPADSAETGSRTAGLRTLLSLLATARRPRSAWGPIADQAACR